MEYSNVQESGCQCTRKWMPILSSVDSTDPSLSDHQAILFSVSVPLHNKPKLATKLVLNFRSINIKNFTPDILSSSSLLFLLSSQTSPGRDSSSDKAALFLEEARKDRVYRTGSSFAS